MIQSKAATVVSALVNAGYVPSVFKDGNGIWTIQVSVDGGVDAATVSSFAAGQGITATVPSVTFT